MRILAAIVLGCFMAVCVLAQQDQASDAGSDKAKQAAVKEKKSKKEQTATPGMPDKSQESSAKPADTPKADGEAIDKDEHYDVSEVAPVVTHHQIAVGGKTLNYTATAGRLPIKRGDGKIEAEMFFIAYTLDGQDAGKRPLTFAFNGGPGSATTWLHMGALGPKHVARQPNGFMPPPPFHIAHNPPTRLATSDLGLWTAI